MNIPLIFLWIILAFIAMAFWEAYMEGKHPWGSMQVGWRKKITEKFTLTAYHFWLGIMCFFFLTLPLVTIGWSLKLFGVIISAAMVGLIVEDFTWFIVNPFYSLEKLNPKDAYWHPWFRIGKIGAPVIYIVAGLIALASWYFLWM